MGCEFCWRGLGCGTVGASVCAVEVVLRDVVLVTSSIAFLTSRSSSCTLVSWETSCSSAGKHVFLIHFSVALHGKCISTETSADY